MFRFKKKEKTELEKATDQLLTGIAEVQIAIENRNEAFVKISKEMQKNADLIKSL